MRGVSRCSASLYWRSLSRGSPLGLRVKSFPSPLGELALELQLNGLWSGCQGMVVYPKGSRFLSFFSRRPAWRQRAANTPASWGHPALCLVLSGTGLSGQHVSLTESTCMGDTLCPELLSSQVWRWPRVLPRAVLFLFVPAFYCSDCFLVTCLAQLLFYLLREINPISLISTGQEGKAGGLTLSEQMAIRMELGEGGIQEGTFWKDREASVGSSFGRLILRARDVQDTGPCSHHCSTVKWETCLQWSFELHSFPQDSCTSPFRCEKEEI